MEKNNTIEESFDYFIDRYIKDNFGDKNQTDFTEIRNYVERCRKLARDGANTSQQVRFLLKYTIKKSAFDYGEAKIEYDNTPLEVRGWVAKELLDRATARRSKIIELLKSIPDSSQSKKPANLPEAIESDIDSDESLDLMVAQVQNSSPKGLALEDNDCDIDI